MPSTPLVSIVIPAFNAGRYIDATLASIFAQTYSRVEVIVVDDGSTDDTRDRLRAYGSRLRCYHQPNSGGCSRPRNAGIQSARGELIAFFDSDDLMLPWRLESHVAMLQRHRHVGVAFSNFRCFTGDVSALGPDHFSTCPKLRTLLGPAQGGDCRDAVLSSVRATELLQSENFGSAMITVRREVFDAVGLYDETLGASEDFDMQYRIAERFDVGVVARVDWHKRLHAASMTSSTENILRWKIHTRERILAREQDDRRRRDLRNTIAQFHLGLAYYYSARRTPAALAHACRGARLAAQPPVRIFARIAADAVRQRFA